jgi:hypothetical protein
MATAGNADAGTTQPPAEHPLALVARTLALIARSAGRIFWLPRLLCETREGASAPRLGVVAQGMSVGTLRYRHTHLGHDHVRRLEDVSSCEAEQAVTGVNQAVLPSVVLDQAVAVTATVVFQTKPVSWVVQIRATEKAAPLIV